jgi:squalene-hopene/tetraprenyl-beta-curcumene cyclase
MRPNRRVHVVGPAGATAARPLADGFSSDVLGRVSWELERALARTREWLLDHQHADGHWCAELEGDTILESEFILLLAFLDQHESETARKTARYLLKTQRADGGWSTYPGGPVDTSVSVKAYFALKLTGHDPDSEPLARARAAIHAHGGADAVNSFTRYYLALLGQISYDYCPAVPPEAVLLPRWAPINLYKISAWSRTIIVPLSIISAYRPVTKIDARLGISELFQQPPHRWPALRSPGYRGRTGLLSWDQFFRTVDRGLKLCQRRGWLPLRRRALAAAENWLLDRFVGSEGLGAIFPPMIWSLVALRCLGYSDDSPQMQYCIAHLRGLMLEEDETVRLQPCKSPVWDTALCLRALAAAGVGSEHAASRRAAQWLLDREVRREGDWAQTVRGQAGGWCFEYANEFYPDVDDTTMVVMALAGQVDSAGSTTDPLGPSVQLVQHRSAANLSAARSHVRALDRLAGATSRAVEWVLSMQNRDGGWGAFDRDNDAEFLCRVPFADHNAMIDPSTPDLTGRALEMLGTLGRRVGEGPVDRGVAYLRRTQEPDGGWFGRWGVNYIYGTWQALSGLAAVGVPWNDLAVVAGVNWLLEHQQPSGGWGETPESYARPELRGRGPVTASQTAWALLGLMAAGYTDQPAVARGVQWLLSTQREDGTWDEPEFTGTGFPQVFYLRYHYYPIYFPLLALSKWARACTSACRAAASAGSDA